MVKNFLSFIGISTLVPNIVFAMSIVKIRPIGMILSPILILISALISIIAGSITLITEKKSKKQGKDIKVKEYSKFIYTIFISIFVINVSYYIYRFIVIGIFSLKSYVYIISLISALSSFVLGLIIIKTKLQSKKHGKITKTKKCIKIAFIISILLFLSTIFDIIDDYMVQQSINKAIESENNMYKNFT